MREYRWVFTEDPELTVGPYAEDSEIMRDKETTDSLRKNGWKLEIRNVSAWQPEVSLRAVETVEEDLPDVAEPPITVAPCWIEYAHNGHDWWPALTGDREVDLRSRLWCPGV